MGTLIPAMTMAPVGPAPCACQALGGISCQLKKITRTAFQASESSRDFVKNTDSRVRPKAESLEVGARNLHFNTLPRQFLETPKHKHYQVHQNPCKEKLAIKSRYLLICCLYIVWGCKCSCLGLNSLSPAPRLFHGGVPISLHMSFYSPCKSQS